MSTIKLTKEPNEVYFKTTTNYELEVDGKPVTIRIEEDSNESRLYYYDVESGTFNEDPPAWIIELGEDDWGDLIFETSLYEAGISSLSVGEEIYTDEDEE
jgi:hypothetical protein